MEESPHSVRLSLAAAMTLGFTQGRFYRGARLKCVNLLLTYHNGCKANCAFCGLAGEKAKAPEDRKFIRVPWKTFSFDDVLERTKSSPEYVSRVCVSMVTHPKSRNDCLSICRRIASETDKKLSVLIAPSVMKEGDLEALADAGVERIGVAVDAATPELFAKLRGKAVNGPHDWDRYWRTYEHALKVFGEGMAGVHLIRGLGETEQELVSAMARAKDMGGSTHLFSFFPEKGSLMGAHPMPPMGSYRRIQLARWLIDNAVISADRITFSAEGRISGFQMDQGELTRIIGAGEAFETSGCPGHDGKTACNRPFGNEKPGPDIRNFPFSPNEDDIEKILGEMWD